ncbi:hypothetical protein GCM10010533_19090 [Mycolicibacterium pallens]
MIVVGYTNDQFGEAAVDAGIAEAALRDTDLLVINSTQGDSYVDAAFAHTRQVRNIEERCGTAGCGTSCPNQSGCTPPTRCWRRWSAPKPSCW